MIYLISDTHFNHKNIIEYEDRPFTSVQEMNDTIIKNWNSIVKDDDIIIHLGDVALGHESDLKWIIPSLKGHKILFRGNHDNKSKQFYLDCGFEEVLNNKLEEINDKIVYFSHRPESRPGDGSRYDIHIYGHVHAKDYDGAFPTICRNGACICVERWDYKPISLSEVLDACSKSSISSSEI